MVLFMAGMIGQNIEVRTVKDASGNPWWIARDICDVLGLDHITNALAKIPEKHLSVIRLQSGGQEREMKTVDEPGL
jgi:anti-repressor protein